MPHPLIGKAAPSFSILDANGATFTLTPGSNGVPIVLFFYSKSGTYGCTKEACQFRDALAEKDLYKHSKVQVIGISSDPVKKQKEFVEKEKLTYPVLSDAKGEARKAYQTGRGLFGLVEARVTFVIDSNGMVVDVLDATMNFSAHSKFVTKWLEKIEAKEKQAAKPTETATADAPVTSAQPQAAELTETAAVTVEPTKPAAVEPASEAQAATEEKPNAKESQPEQAEGGQAQ